MKIKDVLEEIDIELRDIETSGRTPLDPEFSYHKGREDALGEVKDLLERVEQS